MIKYSIILPSYNEETNINEIYTRIYKTVSNLTEEYEVIFINDGSTDNTEQKIRELHGQNSRVKLINFSRNFGHQTAVTAGLNYAKGEVIALLDSDLQDPPEVLPSFFNKINEGYDVVYAIRKNRKESSVKKAAYFLFYRLLNVVSNIKIPLDSGDFCVMNRKIVDILNKLPERNRFIRGLRSWVGYKQIGLEYDRDERFSGKSKYNIQKLFKLAFDGIFSFSYAPLQFLTFTGFSFFVLSILGSLMTVYFKLFTKIYIPQGFPTTIIVILFIGGINMLSLGIIGEYIGRIYDEVKRRAPFLIASTVGFDEKEA